MKRGNLAKVMTLFLVVTDGEKNLNFTNRKKEKKIKLRTSAGVSLVVTCNSPPDKAFQ